MSPADIPKPKVLAIIPARGGSKGLPGKNVRVLGDKPLIAHSIDTARRTPVIDRVIVTTEDEEIARVARAHGGEIPFSRPPELAGDEVLMFPVLTHAVQWLQEHEDYRPDYVVLLQPTSPLRTPEDIAAVVRLAIDKDADAVISLGPVHQHPHWMKRLDEEGRLLDYWAEKMPFRRQVLQELYAINGAVYLVKTAVLVEQQTFYTDKTFGYVMPSERSIDIETAWDFRLAELIVGGRQA